MSAQAKRSAAKGRSRRRHRESEPKPVENAEAGDEQEAGDQDDVPEDRSWAKSDALEARAARDEFLAALRAKPWTKRVEAIEAMIDELRARPSGADLRVLVERLLALTGDDKWEVRRAVAQGLVHIEHPLFEKIAETLEADANQYVAQAARSAADRRRELDREYQRKTDEIDVVAGELAKLREQHGEAVATAAEKLANHQFKLLTNEITHEMRTVVAGLLDALNKLHANLESSRTAKKVYERNLKIGLDRARFLKLMLEETKKYVDDPRYDSEDIEVGELIEKVIGMVKDAITVPTEVKVETETETRPGARVHAPRSRLMQALTSLLKNAIEAC
ncbi:MAG: HAMP domain-containing histidine kinase, partial [Myxococcales bacterium]|nr:HAMP domain-containing histidine kinase [Myxococcales bacterium]